MIEKRQLDINKLDEDITSIINLLLKDIKIPKNEDLALDEIIIHIDSTNRDYVVDDIDFNWLV